MDAEGEAADWLLTTLDAGTGQDGRAIAELGIGVNPGARVNGINILDEKALGTVHVAFGTNVSFGGVNAAAVHVDAILLKPTVSLDDEPFIRDGDPEFDPT
jgi:leucyl aminopeptidase (aminopeptidase T)